MMDIQERLFALQDKEYQVFQAKLIPTVDPDAVIGVRMPALRELMKEVRGTEEAEDFIRILPHRYYEENTLHGLLLAALKDPERCTAELDRFLPYVDNWATCDVISPVSFKKHPSCVLPKVREWLASKHVYAVRFGIGVLMKFYLDEAFDPVYPEWVAAVRSDEYYVNMMIAWYFSTALAKQPETVMPYLVNHRLDPWTHNKTIQKVRESYRISPEMKEELYQLRVIS
ncbi:MAG: DNA alkylation repair protein [Anaerolineaceae bacterium]|nr:DNA alkylation repair protein [Anaerolineaceae bacterium]